LSLLPYWLSVLEAYLQWHRLCYVAVDETRRALLGGARVKSLDFIVFSEGGAGLLIDVKGRRYPAGPPERPRRIWECWSTQEDISGLARWQGLFGAGYRGVLVFAYHILPDAPLPSDADDLWTWRGRRYLLRALTVDDYRPHMRVRSTRWGTVSLPVRVFRELARPFHEFTQGVTGLPSECPF
jgi:hypothetical protein